MSTIKEKTTIEDVWKVIKSLGEAQKEARESQKEVREAQKQTERALQETQEAQQEMTKSLKEEQQKTEKALQETQEAQQEMTKSLKEEQQKTEESLRELSKNINKAHGDFTGKWGKFLEKLVKGDFLNLLRGTGMDVIRVLSRVPFYRPDGTQAGDIDLIAVNGGDIVAVEVKTTLLPKNVNHHLKRLKKFKEYFPEYQDKRLYGGVAYLDEENQASEYAETQGLFIIKSPGGEASVSVIANAKDFRPKEF